MVEIENVCYSLRGAESAIELLADSLDRDEYQSRSAWFIADMMTLLLDQLESYLNDVKTIDNVFQKDVL